MKECKKIELTDIEKKLYKPVYEKYGVYETDFKKHLLKIPAHRITQLLKVIEGSAVLNIVKECASKNLKDFSQTGLYTTFNDNLILLNSKQKETPKIKELMKKYIEADYDARYEMECKFECGVELTALNDDVDERREAAIHNIVTHFIDTVLRVDKEEWLYEIEKRRYEKYNPTAEIVSLNRYDYNIYEFAKYIADNCNSTPNPFRTATYNCFLAGMIVGKQTERKKRRLNK